MKPLFVVNARRGLPKNSLTIEKQQMALAIRSHPIYLENVYVFDDDQRLTSGSMELSGKEASWLLFFSNWIWPTLGMDTANSEELSLSEEMFLEILYKRLWPTTKEDLKELFENHDIHCIWDK